MSGLVEIRKVLEIIASYCPDDDGTCRKADRDLREMLDEIENMDEVDAVSVVHGHWEEIDMRGFMTPGGTPIVRCSVCKDKRTEHLSGVEFPEWRKFCSLCGAKMDEVTK